MGTRRSSWCWWNCQALSIQTFCQNVKINASFWELTPRGPFCKWTALYLLESMKTLLGLVLYLKNMLNMGPHGYLSTFLPSWGIPRRITPIRALGYTHRKPKTKRAKRFLEKREPKLSENIKNAMLIKGGNANLTVTQVLRDVYALKKPYGVLYKKKNITRPFEDQTSLEFFSKKSDCSLFLFGSHNKKRPNNLVIGRMYDYHVLDMIELGIEKFVSLKDIKNSKCPEGTKPMLIFAGNDFDVTEDYRRLKSLLIDFFRGPTVSNIRLAGLECVLHFTALNGKIYFRSYKLLLKKSGCRTPRIELEEMGPSLDLVLRRTHLASDDLYKLSMKMPKALKPKKKKNISHDTFGTTYGRIHMQKQDLSKLQTRKMKGLKKRTAERILEDQEKKSKRIKNN
ncbi:ribosome production factor 2 homolog isoform X1 [Molossus molossus]|nr:ribosome production factor 2 homolog isoform X1 [Molossus molossus]